MTPTRGVILDWQHEGKPGRADVGAVHGDLREIDVTAAYLDAVDRILTARGWIVHRLVADAGQDLSYSARHKWTNDLAAKNPGVEWAYIAAHVNSSAAGTARYGMVGHDQRSVGGKRLADYLRIPLSVVVGECRVQPCNPDDWTKAMRSTIAGVYAGPTNLRGVCLEPCFMQDPRLPGLAANIGIAVADGLIAWAGR